MFEIKTIKWQRKKIKLTQKITASLIWISLYKFRAYELWLKSFIWNTILINKFIQILNL